MPARLPAACPPARAVAWAGLQQAATHTTALQPIPGSAPCRRAGGCWIPAAHPRQRAVQAGRRLLDPRGAPLPRPPFKLLTLHRASAPTPCPQSLLPRPCCAPPRPTAPPPTRPCATAASARCGRRRGRASAEQPVDRQRSVAGQQVFRGSRSTGAATGCNECSRRCRLPPPSTPLPPPHLPSPTTLASPPPPLPLYLQDLSWAQPAKKWEAVLTEMKFGPGPTPEASADKAAVTTPVQASPPCPHCPRRLVACGRVDGHRRFLGCLLVSLPACLAACATPAAARAHLALARPPRPCCRRFKGVHRAGPRSTRRPPTAPWEPPYPPWNFIRRCAANPSTPAQLRAAALLPAGACTTGRRLCSHRPSRRPGPVPAPPRLPPETHPIPSHPRHPSHHKACFDSNPTSS